LSYGYNSNLAGSGGQSGLMTNSAKTVMAFEIKWSLAYVDRTPESTSSSSTTWSPVGNGGWLRNDYANLSGTAVDSTTSFCFANGIANYPRYATGAMGNTFTDANIPGSYPSAYDDADGRHFDGANYLMMDGHVKWFKGSQVSPGFSALAEGNTQTTSGLTSNGDLGGGGRSQGTSQSAFAVTFSRL
jgi:prepilin-type processing-associated H-X9-DG protein